MINESFRNVVNDKLRKSCTFGPFRKTEENAQNYSAVFFYRHCIEALADAYISKVCSINDIQHTL